MTAKQVVLEVLSANPGTQRPVPVRILIRAAAIFGIAENSVRVALARLCAEERLESPARGLYRLGAAARPLHERVVSWRSLEDLVGPWDGSFIGVHTAGLPRTSRAAVRARERAVTLWGFRTLVPGLEVRPANLRAGVDGARERLRQLGLEATAPVARLTDLGPLEPQARGLWDGAELVRLYQQTTAALSSSMARLGVLPLQDAVRESFLLGREAIRVLVKDPLLPEPLVRVEERQRLAHTMRRYDREGHALWRRFLLQAEEPERATA
ncbi:MAG: PaaX family transcriptional regulator [Myxococcota bacterium]